MQSSKFALEAQANGSLINSDIPAFNGSGTLSSEFLNLHNIKNIGVDLSIPSLQNPMDGTISLRTAYNALPLSLSLGYSLENKSLKISDIIASAPDINMNGSLNLNIDNMRANGALKAQISSLTPYAEIIGNSPKAHANLSVILSASDNSQNITAAIKNLIYDQNTVESISVNTSCTQLTSCLPETLIATIKNASTGNGATLSNGNISIKNKGDEFTLNTDITGIYGRKFNIYGSSSFNLTNNFPDIKNIDLKLNHEKSQVRINGSANKDSIHITASTKRFEFKDIALNAYGLFLDFIISGEIDLTGPPNAPQISTSITMENIPGSDDKSVALSIEGNLENQQAELHISGRGDGINSIKGKITSPVSLSLSPLKFDIPSAPRLNGFIDFSVLSEAFANMFLPPEHNISGNLSGSLELAGTLLTPDTSAEVNFNNGKYKYKKYGVSLDEINISTELKDKIFTVHSLSATDGLKGSVSSHGTFHTDSPQSSTAKIKMTDLHLFNSTTMSGIITSDIKLANQYLKGDITLGKFNITIPEQINTLIPSLNISEDIKNTNNIFAEDRSSDINLDINVSATDQIFVRGWGLDAEFGGNLHINGTTILPKIHGDLSSIRGRYEEFGKSFELGTSTLRFQGSIPPSPYLDIVATNTAEDLLASINLHGEFQSPKLTLSSVPSLPEDEIMAKILFGKSMDKITAMQAIQLKNTLDRFSGKGGQGFDPLGTIRNLTGLDDIRVEDDGDETSVGVGKYLTDKVYLEFEQGSEAGSSGAKIQIEVTPSIQVESEVGQDAKAGAGILWHWKY